MSLLAFPLNRRVAFVRALAAQVLARSPAQGEKHFAHQLRRQAKSLRHKGLDEDVVRQQIGALTAAVRRQLWLAVLGAPSTPPTPLPASEHKDGGAA